MKQSPQQSRQRKEESKTALLNIMRQLHATERRCRSMENALTSYMRDIREAAQDCDSVAAVPLCSEAERRAWKAVAAKLRFATRTAELNMGPTIEQLREELVRAELSVKIAKDKIQQLREELVRAELSVKIAKDKMTQSIIWSTRNISYTGRER